MFVDASALTAILLQEQGSDTLLQRLDAAASPVISPLAVWETSVAVARVHGISPRQAQSRVEEFLTLMSIDPIAVNPAETAVAIEAFERYGKGRHPAGLNFGDCFAYACARTRGIPLLYKGDDFSQTDIDAA